MIALYRHSDFADCCWLRPAQQIDSLFELAQAGDTVHVVDDALPANQLIPTVQQQRTDGKCKRL